jgi:PAS domain S-box-containing protein
VISESTVESSTRVSVKLTEKNLIRVLHVDDDLNYLKIAEQCLKMQGRFRVDTVRSAEEAMEKMKKETYDAIISDYQMPGKNGLEFLKELREKGNDTPFIIFTGKGREEVAIKALNLGADGYFDKHGDAETVYGELAHGIRQAVERKKADMKIWEIEERLRAVFGSSPDAITVSDLHGNILDCNEAAWKMLGFSSKEEVIGKNHLELIAEKDRESALKSLKIAFEQGTTKNVEYTFLKKNGEEYQGELSASILRDSVGSPVCFVGVIRDTSERKQREDALRDAKEKWASLTENTDDIVMIVDGNGVIQYINRTIPPYTPEETVGKTVYEYVPREQHDVFEKSLGGVFKTGKPDSYQVSSTIPKIGTIWFSTKVVPIKHDGKVSSAILISSNITDRKKAEEELRNSEEHLKETNKKLEVTNEKLHVVGSLTRHDVRNKLTAVTGNTYLLRQRLAENPKELEKLKGIEAAVQQVARIFEFAGIYEKLGVEQPTYLDAKNVLDEAASLFSDLKGVRIVNDCTGLTVLADSLLRQVFYNMIDNSLKYGETIKQIRVYYKMSSGDELELIYEDDGVGIPSDMRDNLFKEGVGKGTGYGLFTIKRIIEVYGWNIQETGIQGKGVRFVITIPKTNPNGKENYQIA